MTEFAQVTVPAQDRKTSPDTKQRTAGQPPKAAAGVSAPAKNATPPDAAPVATGSLRVTGAPQTSPAPGFPDTKMSGPEVWRPFFAKNQPPVRAVQRHVNYLLEQKQLEHVIALLNAAIIEGQAQPWMYEVLALTMKQAKYPEADIERVVLSVADFGNATFESMLYSGAYLANLGHEAAALRMYRQAARMSPERPEPYSLSLKLAAKTGVADDAAWAACGVLRHAWGTDRLHVHEQAEDLLAEAEKRLQKSQQLAELTKLKEQAAEARSRDLEVRITWNGTGDIDLSVQDPAGGVASFQSHESVGGGILLNDGYGPHPENCHEDYICPTGFTGEYVLVIKKASEKIVGNRAVLTIVTHRGGPAEKKITQTVTLDKSSEQTVRIKLADGRREQRRTAFMFPPLGVARDWERAAAQVGRPARHVVDREVRQAVAEMRLSRQQGVQQAGGGGFGATGFAPIITTIPVGARLATLAVVSPDRRYVRIALSPTFNQIIDVAVFSFQGR